MPNYTLEFHILAREEVSDAYQYYENQKPGLGDKFFGALDDIFDLILGNSNLFPKDFEEVRKATLKKFPFTVYYELTEDQIFIYSVFHQSRNPADWQERIH